MSTFEAHCQESKVRFGHAFEEVHVGSMNFKGPRLMGCGTAESGTMRLA